MANLYIAPTVNFKQTTLNGAISNNASTITLNSVTNLQSPGYVVIDRVDANGVSTPSAREVVSYTGISGSNLTGCVRGEDNSTAQAHSDGAVVETMPTVGMWNSLATILNTGLDSNSYLRAINSPVSIARGEFTQIVVPSLASTGVEMIKTRLDVSGASVTGLGLSPVFIGQGFYSGPTLAIGGLLIAPRPATLKWISVITKYVVSGASIGFDFKVRNASVFANATTQPAIAAGGTFVSTASIATVNINVGDVLQADVSSAGTAGIVQEISIQGGTL